MIWNWILNDLELICLQTNIAIISTHLMIKQFYF